MPTSSNTSSQYFKALSILCYAFTLGIVMFSLIALALTLSGLYAAEVTDLIPVFNILVPVFAVGGLFAGNAVLKKRVLAIKELPGLADKLNGYRAAVIIRYALYEGPALFSIIAFLLTGELKLFIVTGCLVLLMLYRLPKKETLIKDIELSFDEANIINDPDGVIQ